MDCLLATETSSWWHSSSRCHAPCESAPDVRHHPNVVVVDHGAQARKVLGDNASGLRRGEQVAHDDSRGLLDESDALALLDSLELLLEGDGLQVVAKVERVEARESGRVNLHGREEVDLDTRSLLGDGRECRRVLSQAAQDDHEGRLCVLAGDVHLDAATTTVGEGHSAARVTLVADLGVDYVETRTEVHEALEAGAMPGDDLAEEALSEVGDGVHLNDFIALEERLGLSRKLRVDRDERLLQALGDDQADSGQVIATSELVQVLCKQLSLALSRHHLSERGIAGQREVDTTRRHLGDGDVAQQRDGVNADGQRTSSVALASGLVAGHDVRRLVIEVDLLVRDRSSTGQRAEGRELAAVDHHMGIRILDTGLDGDGMDRGGIDLHGSHNKSNVVVGEVLSIIHTEGRTGHTNL